MTAISPSRGRASKGASALAIYYTGDLSIDANFPCNHTCRVVVHTGAHFLLPLKKFFS